MGALSQQNRDQSNDEDGLPGLDHMETLEELSNGFTIGYLDGEWYLFDDEGGFVDKYDSREVAETVAFSMKPPRRYGR